MGEANNIYYGYQILYIVDSSISFDPQNSSVREVLLLPLFSKEELEQRKASNVYSPPTRDAYCTLLGKVHLFTVCYCCGLNFEPLVLSAANCLSSVFAPLYKVP